MYNDNIVGERFVKGSCTKFRNGHTDMVDEEEKGQESIVSDYKTDDQVISLFRVFLMNFVILQELIFLFRIVTERLGYQKAQRIGSALREFC